MPAETGLCKHTVHVLVNGGRFMDENMDKDILEDDSDIFMDAPVSLDGLDDDAFPTEEETSEESGDDDTDGVTKSVEDLYVYDDKEDDPVDDKDLYRDFEDKAPSVKPTVTEQNVISAVPEARKRQDRMVNAAPGAAASEATADRQMYGEEFRGHRDSVKINRIYIVNTVISMFTLCAVAAGIFTGYAYLKKLEQDLGSSKRRIADLETGTSVTSSGDSGEEYVDAVSLIDEEELNEPDAPENDSMVDIDNGKLLLYDSYVGYSWVPVLSGVKPNTYVKENFRVDDDFRMKYVSNGEVSSYFGIDVSSHQGDINWDAVRSDGVEFAILRIGVRGYGEEGNIKLDEKFFDNYENAHKAGLDLGVYFYSQALNVDEAIEEANFVLEQLGSRKLEYPIVFDWEPVDPTGLDSPPRTEDIMPGTLTLSALAFCETIRDAGYDAMIYTNKKMAYIKYDMRKFADYPIWLALYSTDLTYYYDFDMWQYGFGTVDGIEGEVDFDISIIR